MRMHAFPGHPLSCGSFCQHRWRRDRPAGGWHLGDARPGRPRHSISPPGQPNLARSRRQVSVAAFGKCCPGSAFRTRPGWLGAAAVVLAAGLVSACSGGAALVNLPARPDAATRAVNTARPAPASPRQQVVAAYTSYNNALQQAQNTRNARQVQAIMANYVPASSIPAFVSAFRQEWAHGEIGYGAAVSHILHVRLVSRAEAVVDDCLDTTHSGLQYVRTGTVVPGTVGTGHDNLATTLVRRNGRWLVATQTPVEVPCAY